MVALVLAFSNVAFAQSTQQRRTLVVNGQSGQAIVFQIDGRSYIDLETLAHIANGSISVQGDQIVLNLPAPSATAPVPTAADNQSAESGLSNDFMNAAIHNLASVKEWYSTLGYAVQRGIPGDGSRLFVYRDKAAQSLRLATVAASTGSDRSALLMLNTHFKNVQKWNDKLVNSRKSMDTANYSLSPDALNDDPLYQKITRCAQFLGTMLPTGTFEDDGASCH
jgi:hypothetical protein